MEYQFTVQGMTCGHCEMAVKKAITRLDPQAQVVADRTQNQVTIANSSQPREVLVKVIAEEGYQVV
jgi:copper chaperone